MSLNKFIRLLSLLILLVLFALGGYVYSDEILALFNNNSDLKIAENTDENLNFNQEDDNISNKPIEEESNITILAAGDVMYHMPQVRAAYNSLDSSYNFNNNFKYIKPYTSQADLSILNFETTAAGNNLGFSGFPRFNSPVETLDSIKQAGFDIVNLANNHILDQGEQGLMASVNNSINRKLKVLGANFPDKEKYLIEEIENIRLGFLSYSYGFNGHEASYTKEQLADLVNIIDQANIKRDIEFLKDQVDLVIIYIHWGEEYMLSPSQQQKTLAQNIFDWGGDIILGSHPHVIQEAKLKEINGKTKYVIYSMGNFISNQRTETMDNPNTEDGIMVKLNLRKSPKGQVDILGVEHIPTWTYKYFKDKTYYEIVPIEDALNGKIEIYNFSGIRHRLENSLERTRTRIKN